jgi:hypothetical protein
MAETYREKLIEVSLPLEAINRGIYGIFRRCNTAFAAAGAEGCRVE